MAELGVSTFALGARSRAEHPLAVARLARLLRSRRPDVVQTHLVDGCLVGLAAARLARVPLCVMTAHHSHELPFHGGRLVWSDRLCGALAHRVIAPSRSVAATLTEYAHVQEHKIEVVHHGFDFGRLDPARASGERIRKELGLDGALVFGAIGRLYHLKNQEALVRAFAVALRAVPDARLVLAGPGDPTPVTALATELGVAEKIIVVRARTDVPDLLAAFDVFVHPAVTESFGMVIVEAMAMGRPVVSTPVGIAPEVIDPPHSGVLTAAAEPESLAAGLEEMLALRATWTDMGQAARRRVRTFTASAMADRHQELYAEWLPNA
jgi:glycosyltransferase involved in cell wall biosynthesis